MKTTRLALFILVLLAATAPLALAQSGSGPRGDGPCAFTGRLCNQLDLSEEQQVAIDGIREKSRAEGLATRKEILRLRNELDGLMLQDEPDAGAVEKLVRRIGDLKSDQQVRRMKTRLAVRAQLTDEQRDKMIAMQGAHRRGHGGRGRGAGRDGSRHGEGRFECGNGPRGR